MKIAIVNDIYNDTGNGTSMSSRHFVKQLEEQGNEVVILCQGDKKGQEGNVYTFETKHIPLFQKVCEEQHAILAEPDDELINKALEGVDIVHNYLPFWLGTRVAELAKAKGIPVLSCYHISAENITFNAGLRHVPFSEDIVYEVFKRLHFKEELIGDIYCPSQCMADRIVDAGYTQNIHVISNGYNTKFRQIKVEKPQEYKDKFVIVSVGRLTREKRQDIIIKAIGNSKFKDNIVLILAGRGAKQKYYQKLAKKYGVNINFVFLSQDELVKTLNYSDLFIQASDVETESISCLEAIACGTVPIISDARMCATKQFALDNKSIFKHGNYKDLASHIDSYLANPLVLRSMRNNYAESAKKYSLDKSISAIMDVYNNMILSKGKSYGLLINYNNPSLSRVIVKASDNQIPGLASIR